MPGFRKQIVIGNTDFFPQTYGEPMIRSKRIPLRGFSIRLAAVLALVSVYAQAKLSVAVKPNPVFVGESGQLVISSDDGEPDVLDFPSVTGIRWHPNQVQKQVSLTGNFSSMTRTTTVSYGFSAQQPGTFTIPGIPVTVNNRKVVTKPLQLVVEKHRVTTSGKAASLDDLIFMQVTYNGRETPPKSLYLGAELTVTINLYVDQRLDIHTSNFNQARSFTNPENYFPDVALENVVFRDYSHQNKYNNKFAYRDGSSAIVDGRRFQLFVYQTSVSGVEVGTIEGTIRHTVPFINPERERRSSRSNRRKSPFDDFFSDDFFGFRQRNQILTHDLETVLPPIAVRAVPEDENSDGQYLGLIGAWTIQLATDKKTVSVGEDVALTLSISGAGNINSLIAPNLDLPGFRIYPPEVNRDLGETSRGEVRWVLIPLSDESRLPDFAYKTFDPESGRYRRHDFHIDLNVTPAAERGVVGPLVEDYGKNTGAESGETKKLHQSTDILYIKKSAGSYLAVPLWRNVIILVVAAGAGPPLGFLAVLFFVGRRERLSGNESLRRRRNALKRRNVVFRRLKNASQDDIATVVREELLPYLVAVLKLPPGAGTAELYRHIDDPELVGLLEQAEADGFMPGARSRLDAAQLLQRVKRLSIFLLCILWPMAAQCNDTMEQASAAYDQGRLGEAESLYRNMARDGHDNAALLFNLGNCAYRKGEYGAAVYYYERARRLAPRDSDIVENLNFVRSQLNLVPVNHSRTPIDALRALRDNLRPDEWLVAAAAAWTIFWLMLSIGRHRGRTPWVAAVVAMAVVVVSVSQYALQQGSTYARNQAVIVAENTPLFRLPGQNENEKAKMVLGAGESVWIVEERTEWSRIRIDQAEGWVRNTSVNTIW